MGFFYFDNEFLNICVDNDLSIEDHIIAGEEMKKLYGELDKLFREERKIIDEYYFQGKTLKNISEEKS